MTAWRWRLGELFGIVIYMHVTFLLLIGWVALSEFMAGAARGVGMQAALMGVLFILLLFACVVMHEYGHALTARRYGIRTRDITLLPIGGVARLERMPRDPGQELAVALAGPAVNVVIAVCLSLLGLLLMGSSFSNYVRFESPSLLGRLTAVNVWLVVFNLLPAFPMDGGRVLRALLARRMEYARATRAAASVGQMMAFLFGFLGLSAGQPLLILIAVFVYMGAEAEAQMVQLQTSFRGLPVRGVMITRFTALAAEDPLSRAVQLLLTSTQQDFPVATDGRLVGLLTRKDLLSALHDLGPTAPVSQVMRPDVTPAAVDAPLEETFQRMQTDELPAIPVVDGGRLAGLLTMENIAEFLMVRAALEGAPVQPGEVTQRDAAAAERPSWRMRRGPQF